MISIPVSLSTHSRLTTASKWLCIAAFVIFGSLLGVTAFSGYRQANAILKDHTVVTVPVELEQIEEKHGRKGRVSYTYHFRYTFEANGTSQRGAFSTSEGNAAPYTADGATVKVAYANSNPARFERLDKLQSSRGLGAVLRRLLIGLVFASVLALVAHLLITRRLFVVHAATPPPLA